ncbi:hypothetical protein JRO89_XS06G0192100 [Xanthoceras sorbifolium]|uniref:Uncharacterized protein n=1 Tax=Xanthoceras sorbifolium TaxID=99658 RepID=A0ABQ8HYY4_9ROSI|nr:hypothetical protein JRO89_XS06G0192100 [Xanthoceras sorbifolium]
MGKNIRLWDFILPQIEFAYNCSKSQSTNHSPFEVVHGKNPISPLDLLPIVSNNDFSGDVDTRAGEIKKLIAQVREKIVKQNEKYKKAKNKHRKHAEFKEGYMVWIHLSKDCFPKGKYG